MSLNEVFAFGVCDAGMTCEAVGVVSQLWPPMNDSRSQWTSSLGPVNAVSQWPSAPGQFVTVR
jgi:hypothetical protein